MISAKNGFRMIVLIRDGEIIGFLFEVQGIVKKIFEISENFCSQADHILQCLRNRIVKTVFENSKFLCSNPVLTIRFLRLCRMCSAREQNFSEISEHFLRSLNTENTL